MAHADNLDQMTKLKNVYEFRKLFVAQHRKRFSGSKKKNKNKKLLSHRVITVTNNIRKHIYTHIKYNMHFFNVHHST